MIDIASGDSYTSLMTLTQSLGPRLPLTHYDILRDREPWLFDFIEQDIRAIHKAGRIGPFGLDGDFDECNLHLYCQRKVDAIKASMQQGLIENGFDPLTDEELDIAFAQWPEARNLGPIMVADYMGSLNFELFNKKTFYLTGRLIDQLAQTELNAPAEFLRLPFPSCLFVLEGRTALDAMYAISGNSFPDSNEPISIFISERPHEDGLQKLLISCFHSGKTGTHFHIKRELLIHPEWDIEKSLKTDWAKLYEEHPDWNDARADPLPHALVDESPFYEEGMQFFRIIVNAMLYLSSNDVDIIECFSPRKELEDRLTKVKSKVKKRKARNDLNKTSSLDYSAVGTHLSPILVDKGRRGTESGNASKSPLDSATRFIVRGHWRNQPCGEKLQDRRLIWIQPYFKGPDMGELINRPYIVE